MVLKGKRGKELSKGITDLAARIAANARPSTEQALSCGPTLLGVEASVSFLVQHLPYCSRKGVSVLRDQEEIEHSVWVILGDDLCEVLCSREEEDRGSSSVIGSGGTNKSSDDIAEEVCLASLVAGKLGLDLGILTELTVGNNQLLDVSVRRVKYILDEYLK